MEGRRLITGDLPTQIIRLVAHLDIWGTLVGQNILDEQRQSGPGNCRLVQNVPARRVIWVHRLNNTVITVHSLMSP